MPKDKLQLERELKALTKRIHALESISEGCTRSREPHRGEHEHGSQGAGVGSCNMPIVPERQFAANVSSHRESLIRYMGKKWLNGTKLKYYFFTEGPFVGVPSNLELVREAFEEWAGVGLGLSFEETVDIDDAHIRIGFLRGDGSWSYVGRDVIDVPGRQERTMNFGWDLTQDPRGGGLDTPIHEVGHTLGFPHEHQNPFSGIVWNETAVYEEFSGPPNRWSRAQIEHNILRKLSPGAVEGSEWDPDSIMHYGFGAGLIVEPAQYRNGLAPRDGLTGTDKAEVRKFYPPMDKRHQRKLSLFEVEKLSIEPGEQLNFAIEMDRSDDYTIQTLGSSDTLMVLFEDVDGEMEVIAGDDDSGSALNAKLKVRLLRGRRYLLRVRLYLNWASGESAVLLS